jgi:hypothetical protein
VLLTQHTATAVLAVGLRQKAPQQRFLIATTASRVFQQHIRVYLRSFAVQIRFHPCIEPQATSDNPW